MYHTPTPSHYTGMHAEQYKLLDILILLEAQGVVTHYKSLGGLFLNEYRHLVHRGAKRMTRVQTQVGGGGGGDCVIYYLC